MAVALLSLGLVALSRAAGGVAARVATTATQDAAVQQDCGCAGDFVAAKVSAAKAVEAAPPDGNGYSANRTFRVSAAPGSLAVTRVADGHRVLTLDGSMPGSWGFSPDGNRFLVVGPGNLVSLYDLTRDQQRIFQTDEPDTAYGFSPRGRYVVINHLSGQSITNTVIVAATGETVSLAGSGQTSWAFVGFAPGDTSFLGFDSGGDAGLYALPSGERIWQYAGAPAAFGFSANGHYLEAKIVTATTHVDLAVINTRTGDVFRTSYDFSLVPYAGPDPPSNGGDASSRAPASSSAPTASTVSTTPSSSVTGSSTATSATGSATMASTSTTSCASSSSPPTVGSSTTSPTGTTATVSATSPGDETPPAGTGTGVTTSDSLTTTSAPKGCGAKSSDASSESSSSSHAAKGPTFSEETTGFGPDGNTLLIAYVTGQNQVTLTLINLDTGNAVLAGDDVARTDTWSFSPCGDEFARTVVAPNGSEQIDVIATSDGRRIAQQDVPYESVTFTATEAEYLATVGDTTVTLGANLECVVTTVTVPTSIPYGYTSARVTLANDRPAPDGGVTLEVSTDSAYLTAPDAVTMGPGATSGSFTLTVAPVPSDLSATVTVTRSGVINDDVHALTVDVLSAEATQVSLDDSHVAGGGTVDGMVWIDQAAQGPGVDVALSSDSPAVTAPATVHIPAGEEAAEFTATTTAVDTPTTATITAASGGKTVTTTLQVDPILAADLTVTLVPPSGVAVAGETVTITATVSRPPGADPTIPITPPTGTITFTDVGTEVPSQTGIPMGTVLGTATLHSSEAAPGSASGSLSTTGLAVGTHTIQVGYGGDGAYLASVVGTTVDVVAGLTWTGRGDGSSFSDPGNWSAGRAPRTGDVLGIQVADATTIDDDIPGLGVAGLHLSGPITLTGDSLTLTGDLVTHGGPRVEMLVEVPAGSHGLFADGLAAVSGAISGAGSLAITTSGTGTLALTADSSYTGGTAIDGSVETAAGTALGGGEVAVAAGGRLCIVDGSTLRASLTVAAGDLSGCAPPDGAESDDGGDPVSATLDGDLRIAGSLTLACLGSVDRDGGEEQHDDQFTHPLRIAGAITGAGGIRSCATDVTFAGAEANTYGGTTMLSEVGFDDRDYTAVLTLSKPDGVIALPGDLTGSGDLTLDADGQIATTATISAETLTVGGHTAQVADLGVHTLNVGIDGAVTGRVRVTGTADVSDVGVTVDSDATVGSTATVLDLTSSGAIADCPDDVVVPGSRVTDYRTDCSAGNGNDLALTAIWHPSIGIAADPPDGHLAGSDATITATVTAAPGAPAATGFVQFTGFTWRNGYWNPTGVIGSAQLSDGVATLTYRDSGEVMLRADYLGDSIHGPGTSGSMRYVSWSSPAASVPARPTDVAAGERDGGQTLEVTWTAPDGVAYPYPVDQIVDYHVTLTPDDGTPPVRVSTNVSDDPATYRYETFPVLPRVDVSGLHPGVTYAITVIAVNTAGAGPASDPAEFTMPADDGARPPGPPTTPVATAGQGQVGLTWTAPDDDGGAPIDHYEIVPYVHNVPGAPIDTPTDARSYTVAGLRAGTAYQFTVAAVTVAGVGDPSDPSDPVIPTAPAIVTTVPDAPTDLRVSAQGTAASLTWDAPDDGGTPIIGYRVTATIMKSGQGQSTSFVAGTWNADGTRITIMLDTITDPWTSGTYRLTVAASNTVGTGPESDPVEVDAVYVRPGSGPGTTGVVTTTTTTPPLPSPTGDDGDSSNHVGQAGGDLAVTAGGFDPGEPVTITLHSTPVVLATVTADGTGTVNAVVHIPVDTVPGGHTLNLVGVRSGHQVVIALEVTAPPTATSAGPTRPASALTSTGLRVVLAGTDSAIPSAATTGSVAVSGPPSDNSGLASTGAPIGGWLRLAGLLLLAGAGAVGLAARRREAPARHR